MWQQPWWAIRSLSVTLTPPSLPPPSPLSGYTDVGVIPVGARDIVVKEVEEAGNFLALKSESSEEYFLNGNYIIQWNGEYVAGGTTFYYERSGNMENLTAPGPTKQPVMLQVGFFPYFSSIVFFSLFFIVLRGFSSCCFRRQTPV